jgi:hypothetical protein
MATRAHERRSIWRVGPESTWTTILPVAFIIISLISLVILPIVVAKQTARMRDEITSLAEPARRIANEVQMDVASEINTVIAFQVTGQRQFRDEFVRQIGREASDYAALGRLAPQLNLQVNRDLETLVARTNRWHIGVKNGEFLQRQLPSEVFLQRLFEQHPDYKKALVAAGNLEIEIQEAIDDRLKSIRDLERWNISLTIILTLLALTSAMLVAGLGRQMRLLAREAMARRRDAEREATDAKIARAAAEREERRAAFLAAAGQELTASLDFAETIGALARLYVPNLGEICAIDLAESDGALRRAALRHRDDERDAALQPQVGNDLEEIPEAATTVMSEREARIFGSTPELLGYVVPDPPPDTRSMMLVPLVSRGQTLGVVTVIAPEGRVFAREDVALASELARHGSLAIDNARLYLESQQAVRAREEVLAIVSHDLRNPLNAVMLAAELMKSADGMPPEELEQVETIQLSAQRMRRLIEDLLDVTRLEGGKQLPVEPAPLEVKPLLQEIYELFKTQAASGSIGLRYDVDDDVPPVYADHHRITQVLSNLVGNSMKFTPADGKITCRAKPSNGQVIFAVSDTGPGIPQKNLKDIWAESEPGKGTTFYFTLPVARDAKASPTFSAESPAHSRR